MCVDSNFKYAQAMLRVHCVGSFVFTVSENTGELVPKGCSVV